jgi:hypothetical protein
MQPAWFGLQSLQRPVAMSQLEHGSGSLTQAVPVLLHVCGVFPMHCREPGWQMPVQAPPEQTLGQSMASTHLPVASHVCRSSGLLGEQRTSVMG